MGTDPDGNELPPEAEAAEAGGEPEQTPNAATEDDGGPEGDVQDIKENLSGDSNGD